MKCLIFGQVPLVQIGLWNCECWAGRENIFLTFFSASIKHSHKIFCTLLWNPILWGVNSGLWHFFLFTDLVYFSTYINLAISVIDPFFVVKSNINFVLVVLKISTSFMKFSAFKFMFSKQINTSLWRRKQNNWIIVLLQGFELIYEYMHVYFLPGLFRISCIPHKN